MSNEISPIEAPVQVEEKPKTVGHYALSKTIGEGTFGKVKLSTHTLTGERVAIKILEKDKITDVNDVERVAREIHILKLIRHPNIINFMKLLRLPNSSISSWNTATEENCLSTLSQIIESRRRRHADSSDRSLAE